MGKSYRKTPITGHGGHSEKKDKQIANQKFRTRTKQALHTNKLNDLPHVLDEVHNKWSMAKDGKHYLKSDSEYYKSGKWRRK